MLNILMGIALNTCVACTEPRMPQIYENMPGEPTVELVKHTRRHFVRTKRAWRYCRSVYGKRLTAAYESRTKFRCLYRVRRR